MTNNGSLAEQSDPHYQEILKQIREGTAANPPLDRPKWHILRSAGAWLFWMGVVVFALAFFIPDAIPEAPRSSYGESIDLDAYRAQLQTAQNYARISALANWLANKAIAGGFLMWLAGRVIDAFRHPEVY